MSLLSSAPITMLSLRQEQLVQSPSEILLGGQNRKHRQFEACVYFHVLNISRPMSSKHSRHLHRTPAGFY